MNKIQQLEKAWLDADLALYQAGSGFHEDLFFRYLSAYLRYRRALLQISL